MWDQFKWIVVYYIVCLIIMIVRYRMNKTENDERYNAFLENNYIFSREFLDGLFFVVFFLVVPFVPLFLLKSICKKLFKNE